MINQIATNNEYLRASLSREAAPAVTVSPHAAGAKQCPERIALYSSLLCQKLRLATYCHTPPPERETTKQTERESQFEGLAGQRP